MLELRPFDSLHVNTYTPACLAKTTEGDKFSDQLTTVAGFGAIDENSTHFIQSRDPHHVQVSFF